MFWVGEKERQIDEEIRRLRLIGVEVASHRFLYVFLYICVHPIGNLRLYISSTFLLNIFLLLGWIYYTIIMFADISFWKNPKPVTLNFLE